MINEILLNQFYIYFVLIIIGFLASKFKIINSDNSSLLSDFILHITFPLLIFTTLTNLTFDIAIFKNIVFVFLFTYICIFILFIVSYVSSIICNLQELTRKVHIMHTLFGNIVFIGFPFLNSLFPDGHGILYAAVFQLASDSVLWTIGIIYIRNDGQKDKMDSFRHLFNINTISFFASFICIVIGFKIPAAIEKPFSMLGGTTLVLSLVFVGHLLSSVEFKSTVKKKSLYILSFNKLLFVPFIILTLIYYLKINFTFLEKAAIAAIILQCGMPAMATIAILAKKYNSDYKTASENIFVTTILSILTLPFLWFLINIFFK